MAGDVAERFAMRAYDAVHLASALTVGRADLMLVTWDEKLEPLAVGPSSASSPDEASGFGTCTRKALYRWPRALVGSGGATRLRQLRRRSVRSLPVRAG